MLKPISQKQFLVTINQAQAYFTKVSGIQESWGTVQYNDGQTGQVRKHTDFLEVADVTLSKPYDPAADQSLIEYLRGLKTTGERVTIPVQPVGTGYQADAIDGAKTLVLSECDLISITYPSVDREASAMAMLEIVVNPQQVVFQ
jgi:hypothetical protein